MSLVDKPALRPRLWPTYTVLALIAAFFLWIISFTTSPAILTVVFVVVALIIIGHFIDQWAAKITTRLIKQDPANFPLRIKVTCYAISAALWLASTLVLFWAGMSTVFLALYTLIVSTSGTVIEHLMTHGLKRPNWIGRMQGLYCLLLFVLAMGFYSLLYAKLYVYVFTYAPISILD